MVDSEASKQVQCVTRFVEAQQNLPSDDLVGMDDVLMEDTQQGEEQKVRSGHWWPASVCHTPRTGKSDDLISQVAKLQQILKKILLELESTSRNQKWLMYSDLRNMLGQSHSLIVGSCPGILSEKRLKTNGLVGKKHSSFCCKNLKVKATPMPKTLGRVGWSRDNCTHMTHITKNHQLKSNKMKSSS